MPMIEDSMPKLNISDKFMNVSLGEVNDLVRAAELFRIKLLVKQEIWLRNLP